MSRLESQELKEGLTQTHEMGRECQAANGRTRMVDRAEILGLANSLARSPEGAREMSA